MKIELNGEACIGCGMCVDICPEVFQFNEEYKSRITDEFSNKEISDAKLCEKVKDCCETCPVGAISCSNE